MKKIAPDKWKHFFVGIAMGIVLQAFFLYILPDHLWLSIILTFVFVCGISYGFEFFSLVTGIGYYEVMDAVAAIIGGILGMAGVLVIKFAIIAH